MVVLAGEQRGLPEAVITGADEGVLEEEACGDRAGLLRSADKGLLFLVALPTVARTSWTAFPVSGWLAIGYSAIGALVIAYWFWYRGVRILGPTRTSMYSNLQPIIAMIVAWLMLGEVPTLWQVIGAASIMGGLLLTRT